MDADDRLMPLGQKAMFGGTHGVGIRRERRHRLPPSAEHAAETLSVAVVCAPVM
jgi:hypothetical protein